MMNPPGLILALCEGFVDIAEDVAQEAIGPVTGVRVKHTVKLGNCDGLSEHNDRMSAKLEYKLDECKVWILMDDTEVPYLRIDGEQGCLLPELCL